jgi:uncharacterized protein YhfF
VVESDDLQSLPRWGFVDPGPLRDKLTSLALEGTKTATPGLLVEYELDGLRPPLPGERSVLLDSNDRAVAIVETVSYGTIRLEDVDDRHAVDEGEGYANAAEYRADHVRFWRQSLAAIRAALGDPTFDITDDTLVVAERFRIIRRLDPA